MLFRQETPETYKGEIWNISRITASLFFANKTPTVEQRLKAIVEHAELLEKINKKNFDSIKKYFHSYTKGFRGSRELRDNLMKAKNLMQTKKIVEDFLVKC